ncbi:NUDIX domain-containing protein [Mucilaginibacter arboris]|uniref:NUDIX domain-containing protein n=1 Tax=Mucilaginibacter arboris TaxID=2682090 RepID=A0A7K1SZC7_9SPHI|nr:NUDIX domain-containing protein [Mucilaginibacter arboris]MVN22400.1 NUDIX domain-containing protein [Mucilaginibacter arboris]
MLKKYPFNVRVYGLLINENEQLLISDEQEYGMRFSKFPGGGLEYGEGLIDGLKREFIEECNFEVEIISHFYTTDFYLKSAFDDTQIISVYYLVKNIAPINLPVKTVPFDFDGESADGILQSFRWLDLNQLKIDDVTFPADQKAVELLLNTIK